MCVLITKTEIPTKNKDCLFLMSLRNLLENFNMLQFEHTLFSQQNLSALKLLRCANAEQLNGTYIISAAETRRRARILLVV